VKICCISSVDEARLAIRNGADALGLVGKMPSGPGVIADDLIVSIARYIHSPVASFLLTSEQSADAIIDYAKRTNVNTLQLVDEVPAGTYAAIRRALPYIQIVQVIHVISDESIGEALAAAKAGADLLLMDSGNPKAAVKTLGGTGNIHNWEISRAIVDAVTIPVFLAGGLHAGNVKEAIEKVRPFGVDICSGVRTNGRLDEDKLSAFMHTVMTAG